MKKRTPQEAGYDFEKHFGAILGVKPTKGSGNQWFAKMDLAEANILVSCKHTDAASYRVERSHLKEIQAACSPEQEPVLAVSVQGEVYIIQRAGDWVANMTKEGGAAFLEPSKSQAKRRASRVPRLLVPTDEEE